jgi:hypothetical protein
MPRKATPSSAPKTESSAPTKVTPDSKTPGAAEKPKPQAQPRLRRVNPDIPQLDY